MVRSQTTSGWLKGLEDQSAVTLCVCGTININYNNGIFCPHQPAGALVEMSMLLKHMRSHRSAALKSQKWFLTVSFD